MIVVRIIPLHTSTFTLQVLLLALQFNLSLDQTCLPIV